MADPNPTPATGSQEPDRFLTVISQSPWGRRAVLFWLGVFLAMGQAPVNLPFGLFLVIPILVLFWRNSHSHRQAYGVGWWAGLGYFSTTMFWIIEPFFVEPEIYGWMALFALFFLAAGLALFWGGAFAVASKFWRGAYWGPIGLACLWMLAEFLRSHIFTGFPWGLIAYGWVNYPVIQLVSVIGPHGLGLVTVLTAMIPIMLWGRFKLSAGLMAGIAVLAVAFGLWRVPSVISTTDVTIRLLQPNAAQHLKWRSDMVQGFYQSQLDMTEAPSDVSPDLIVWPETALPFALGDNTMALQAIASAAGPTSKVIAGIMRFQGPRLYNSMVIMDEQGGLIDVYDKHHLVPFGEYIPLISYLSQLGLKERLLGEGSGYSPGIGPRIVDLDGVPRFLPTICYEAIFPGAVQVPGDRPEWILHITNDAWFGEFSGPYQHLAQVRVRAIEQGLPIARSANTGISAMIDPYGGITDQLGLGEKGYLDVVLPSSLRPTWYSAWGEWPFFLSVAFLLLWMQFPMSAAANRRQIK